MRYLSVFLVTTLGLVAADAPTPVGDWHGTLNVGAVELRLALHVQQGAPAQLKATLDSLDQGANGIPASSTTFLGNTLKMEFPAVAGSYDAQISADGKALTGTWTQNGNSLPLSFARGAAPAPAADPGAATAEPLVGIWDSVLETASGKLRLRLNIRKDDKGNIVATTDSLDQNAMGMRLTGMSLKGSAFHFDVKSVGGAYDGTVDEKKTTIKGTWRQGPGELPLVWTKQ